tara:strand:+ start:4580 stop:4816 length:237 start_codon:yes stop_codon:yes gene_type:complete
MSIFLELQIKLLEKDRLELREEIIKLKLDKEALKKQFSLNGVSQQRELLIALLDWVSYGQEELSEWIVDNFLKKRSNL